ncbi:MAG: hypothetical protein HC841_01005 [Verrucomicrobiae bacterium]|nr:hypothetical protein [Verrucomicrobiae bacterium]
MSQEQLDTATFKFSQYDLLVLLSFMEFCDGGPHKMEEDRKRFEYQFRKALDDHFPGWNDELE